MLSRYLPNFDAGKLKQPPNPDFLDMALHFSNTASDEWDALTAALELWTEGISPPQFTKVQDTDAFRETLEDFARCDAVDGALAKPRSSQTRLFTLPTGSGTSPPSICGSARTSPPAPTGESETRKRPLRDQPPRASKARILSGESSDSNDDVSRAVQMVRKAHTLPPEEDTTILRFPPDGGRGSVSLKKSDLFKLDEGEWLNDTIIDFALKYVRSEVEASQSEEQKAKGDDIMVLSPFFYSQLTSAKNNNRTAGYEKVKKWTKGPIAFQRRYIVVPINEHLHWYFAIIVHPERILRATSKSPEKREETDTRSSQRLKDKAPKESPSPVGEGHGHKENTVRSSRTLVPSSSEEPSCSSFGCNNAPPVAPTEDHAYQPISKDERSSRGSEDVSPSAEFTAALSSDQADNVGGILAPASSMDESIASMQEDDSAREADDEDTIMVDVQPGSLVGGGNPIIPGAAHLRAKAAISLLPTSEADGEGVSDKTMEDASEHGSGASTHQAEIVRPVESGEDGRSKEKNTDAHEREHSIGNHQVKGAGKTQSQMLREERTLQLRQDKARDALDQDELPVVITFDSLRGRNGHQKVNRDLSSWLRQEALNKAGVILPTVDCKYLDAILPQQPNWWDCGIYVIHFFHRFALDPPGALQAVRNADDRDPFWHAEDVQDKRMEMRSLINTLSAPWLASQQTKEDSDDDAVQMVEKSPEV